MKGPTKNTRPFAAGYDILINVVISIIRLLFRYQEYLRLGRYEDPHS